MSFLALSFFVYFAPAIVASSRHHPSATAIWFTNAFTGWTGVGWLVCLVWALSVPPTVILYPPTRYIAPREVPGRPPRWTSVDGKEEPTCLACYRPLQESSQYCSMCGAIARRSA